MPGRRGDQGAGIVGVDQTESTGFSGSGVAFEGAQGHSDGDLCGQARAVLVWIAVCARGCVPVRIAARVRGGVRTWVGIRGWIGDGAAVAFLEQIEVGADPEFAQGAGHPGRAEIQSPLFHMLPRSENLVARHFPADHARIS
jgi:hypothetical protein